MLIFRIVDALFGENGVKRRRACVAFTAEATD